MLKGDRDWECLNLFQGADPGLSSTLSSKEIRGYLPGSGILENFLFLSSDPFVL